MDYDTSLPGEKETGNRRERQTSHTIQLFHVTATWQTLLGDLSLLLTGVLLIRLLATA